MQTGPGRPRKYCVLHAVTASRAAWRRAHREAYNAARREAYRLEHGEVRRYVRKASAPLYVYLSVVPGSEGAHESTIVTPAPSGEDK